jgi:hypothetical protein
MTDSSSDRVLDIVVRDIEPIRGERRLGTLQPGINVVRGANGSGKTTTLRLIALATSSARAKPGEFQLVAGAAKGYLRYGGRTLVIDNAGGISRKGDAPPVEPIAQHFEKLDDPGLVGAQPRADERLRALCAAFGIEPTTETLRRLLPPTAIEDPEGESGEEWDAIRTAVGPALSALERVPATSVPAAAHKIKAALQEERRRQEAKLAGVARDADLAADRHTRAQAALEADAGDELAELGENNLVKRLETATAEVNRVKAEHEAGRKAAAERALWAEQVAAVTVDRRPELQALIEKIGVAWAAANTGIDQADAEIARLEKELAAWRAERAGHIAEKAAQQRATDAARQELAEAERQQKLVADLRQRLAAAAGPTVDADDVELAESSLAKVQRLIGYRERQLGLEGLQNQADIAEQQRVELVELVDRIAAVDGAVWTRLGAILAEKLPAGTARVVEGRVEAIAPNGEWRDLDNPAFSEGQRWELVLSWMIAGAKAGQSVKVEGDCPIDDDGLRRLSPLAAAKVLTLTLEKEEAGAALRIDHMGGV